MRAERAPGTAIRISPGAPVLPANTLRFCVHFPRAGEAHFSRDRLWLRDAAGRAVPDPFLVLSQELWSVDGRRLTVLIEPGRIKRGMGLDPSHAPSLVEGRRYSLEVEAFGHTARHDFEVGERVSTPLDETLWRVASPPAADRQAAVIAFDRVMDVALCGDGIAVLDPAGGVVPGRVSLEAGGRSARFAPDRPWIAGPHRLLFSSRLEDVCGNRLGEALDHDLGGHVRPRGGVIVFTVG